MLPARALAMLVNEKHQRNVCCRVENIENAVGQYQDTLNNLMNENSSVHDVVVRLHGLDNIGKVFNLLIFN